MAGYCKEGLWQPGRRLHWLEQPHACWQRVSLPPRVSPILDPAFADYRCSVALLSPLVLIAIFTLIFGLQHYDWKSMMQIRQGDDHDVAAAAHIVLENTAGGHVETNQQFEVEQKKLLQAGKLSKIITAVLT